MKQPHDDTASRAGKPTLEDLLLVKRAERPDADFWREFDHGLRQKQLAAMIEPKPWWLGASLFLRRHRAALSVVPAAAAAAVAFVAIGGGAGTAQAPVASTQVADAGSAPATPSTDVMSPVETLSSGDSVSTDVVTAPAKAILAASDNPSPAPSVVPVRDELRAAPAASEQLIASPVNVASSVSAPAGTTASDVVKSASSPLVVASVEPAANSERPEPTFLARIAEPASSSPARSDWTDGFMPGVISGIDEVFDRIELAAATTHPVAFFNAMSGRHEDTPDVEAEAFEGLDERHARLLAATGSERFMNASVKNSAQTRERVVHRLGGGEELYASVSRLGVSGDRLSLKF